VTDAMRLLAPDIGQRVIGALDDAVDICLGLSVPDEEKPHGTKRPCA
jgi:hypothetical protein